MKQLIEHIQRSIWSPEYYNELLIRKAGFSWKYYWGFTMFLAVLMTIVTSLPLIPKLNAVLRDFPTSFLAYYPDELEIRVDKGEVASNVEQPYFLTLPASLKETFGSTSNISFLAVIDTKNPVTLEQFLSYRSLFWLSKHSLAYVEQQRGMTETMLPPEMTLSVTERTLRDVISRIEPYFHLAAPLLVVTIFFALFVRFILNLIYLVVIAVVIFLLGLLLKRKWNYGTSYRIALHATTLPLLVEQVFFFVPIPALHVPFLFSAILLFVVFLNYRIPALSLEAPSPRV